MRRSILNRFTLVAVDHLALSLLWLASCLGVVTAPAGTAALFELARRRARGENPGLLIGFWDAFRQYFTASLMITLGWGAFGALLAFNLMITQAMAPPVGQVLLVALLALALLYTLATVTLFPVMVSYQARPLPLVRQTVLVTLLAPERAVVGLAVLAAAAAAVWVLPLAIVIVPSLTAVTLQRLYRGGFARLRAKSAPHSPDRAAPAPATAAAVQS